MLISICCECSWLCAFCNRHSSRKTFSSCSEYLAPVGPHFPPQGVRHDSVLGRTSPDLVPPPCVALGLSAAPHTLHSEVNVARSAVTTLRRQGKLCGASRGLFNRKLTSAAIYNDPPNIDPYRHLKTCRNTFSYGILSPTSAPPYTFAYENSETLQWITFIFYCYSCSYFRFLLAGSFLPLSFDYFARSHGHLFVIVPRQLGGCPKFLLLSS